jgi:hypothetical protein
LQDLSCLGSCFLIFARSFESWLLLPEFSLHSFSFGLMESLINDMPTNDHSQIQSPKHLSRPRAERNADIRNARDLSLQKLANAEARHSAALLRQHQLEAEIESLTHELASLRAADIPNLERSIALVLQLHELAIPKACADAQQQTSPQHCGRKEGSFTPPISPKQSSCSGGNTPSSSAWDSDELCPASPWPMDSAVAALHSDDDLFNGSF